MLLDEKVFKIEEYKIKNDGLNRREVVNLFGILNEQVDKNALDYKKLLRKTTIMTGFEKGRILEFKDNHKIINEIYEESIVEKKNEKIIKNYLIDDLDQLKDSHFNENFIYVKNISEMKVDDELSPFIKMAQDFCFESMLCYPIIDEAEQLIGIVLLTSKAENNIGHTNLFYVNYMVGLLRNSIALNLAKERYQLAFDNEFTGFMILDNQGIVIDVNERCSKIFEYEIEEMLGKSYKYFLNDESYEKVKYNFEQRTKDNNIEKIYETKIVTKNNLVKNLRISVDLLNNKNNRIIKIEDITKQLLLNEKNDKLLKKYQTLFNDSKIIMLIIDPKDGQILDANNRAVNFYGYNYDDLIALKITAINTLSKKDVKNEMDLAKNEKREFFKFEHKLANGTIKNVEVYSGPIDYLDQTVLYSIVIDVTKKIEIEEKLKQKNKYEKALNEIQNELIVKHVSYENIWHSIINNCNIDTFRILFHERDCIQNTVNFSANEDQNFLGNIFSHNEEIIEKWTEFLTDNYIFDVDTKKFTETNGEISFVDKTLVKSIIAIPIIKDDKVYASIGFELYEGKKNWTVDEKNFLKAVGRIIKLNYELSLSQKEVEQQLINTVEALTSMLKFKDPYTYKHQKNVKNLSLAIAKIMQLDDDTIESIAIAASLHDIGKMNIPSEILTKPGKITNLEVELIKGHAKHGYDLIKNINFDGPIAKIVKQHHERLDGSGYPEGLGSREILLEAKIIAVADVVDAMLSDRPYRKSLGVERTLEELNNNTGIKFDLKVVEALEKVLMDKSSTISNQYEVID